MIPALVLTAGMATRLRPLSLVRAKSALPVAGEPLVRRILQSLASAGVIDAVLNLHYLPHTITRIVGDGSDLGLRVRYSWETPLLGSAGGPRRALPLLSTPGADTFLVLNGDTLSNVDLGAVVERHRSTGALVTMALVPNTEPDKYGGVLVEDDVVTGFVRRGTPQASYHFFGVQVIEGRALRQVPEHVPYESVATLYPSLINSGTNAVRAFICSAEYIDIGTPADYLKASERLSRPGSGGVSIGSRSRVDARARVERSILWDDVSVEAGAMVRECVVTDGVTVPAGTSWHGVTIRPATGALQPGERRVDGLAIGSL